MGSNRFRSSDFVKARHHLEQVMALETSHPSVSAYLRSGHDAVSCSLAQLAMLEWLTGHPQRGLERARQAVARCGELNHPPSVALAYTLAAWTHVFRREGDDVLRLSSFAVSVAREQGLPFWEAVGKMMQGRALTHLGSAEEGDRLAERGIRDSGGERRLGIDRRLRPARQRLHAPVKPLPARTIDVAFRVLRRHRQRYFEAELHRLRGELLMQQRRLGSRAGSGAAEAEQSFRRAVAVARRQRVRSLELRAAIRLRASPGQRNGVRH